MQPTIHLVHSPVSAEDEFSVVRVTSPEMLPSLLSCDVKLSPVKRLDRGDAHSLAPLRPKDGENFSRLSVDLDLGVGGAMRPRNRGEFLLSFGVLRSSLRTGEA